MKTRPMKRVEKRNNPDAFWNKYLNPITMIPDRNRDRKIHKLRKIK